MRQPPVVTTAPPLLARRFATRRGRIVLVLGLCLVLAACAGGTQSAEVAIVGLEATTYVNDSITFEVAVVGDAPDSLELRRDGVLFQVLSGATYTWDVSAVPEASYSFVARARRGDRTIDSLPRVVVVDRTPASMTLTVTPSATPMVLPGGVIAFAATAADSNGVPRVEFLDGDAKIGEDDEEPYELTVDATQGVHAYSARVVDAAGNVTLSETSTVPVYARQTLTLTSEAALDGCVSAGYEPGLFTRDFGGGSCTWTTSWSILHFFSFDRSVVPGALVEEAILRFDLYQAANFEVFLAGVQYPRAEDAPPTSFIYPFVSTVPEVTIALDSGSSSARHAVDVTTLVQADVAEDRDRSQLRLRTQGQGPGALGGTVYFAEIADDSAPTLELKVLVP